MIALRQVKSLFSQRKHSRAYHRFTEMASADATQALFVDAAYALLVSRGCTTPEKAIPLSNLCEDLQSMWPSIYYEKKPLHCLRKHTQKVVLIEGPKSMWRVWAFQALPLQPATTTVAAAEGDLPPQPDTNNARWTVHALDIQLIEVVKSELAAWGGCANMSSCGDALYGHLYADTCGPNVGHRKREDIQEHIMAAGGLHAWLTGFPQAFQVSPSGADYSVTLVAKPSLPSSATSALTPSLGAATGTRSSVIAHGTASAASVPSSVSASQFTPPPSTPHPPASAVAPASVSVSASRGFFDAAPNTVNYSAYPPQFSSPAAGTGHTSVHASQHSIPYSAKPAATLPAAAAVSYRLASGELVELVNSTAQLKQLIASDAILRGDADCIVAVDCEGVPQSLHLMQLAYMTTGRAKRIIILDGMRLGETDMCKMLEPLLTSQRTVKLLHDLHKDAAALATIGGVKVTNCIDSQLVMELLHGTLHMGFNDMLQKLDHAAHPLKSAMKQRMNSADASVFSRRPLPRDVIEYAALDVALLLSVKDKLLAPLGDTQYKNIQKSSNIRAQHAAASGGRRRICADLSNGYALASRELVQVFRPESMQAVEPLVVSNEIAALLQLLPADITSGLIGHEEDLSDIQLDKGRRPLAWVDGRRLYLGADERTVSTQELEGIVKCLGGFGSDNRAGLEAQLHRISAIRNRTDTIIGLTMRVGRHVAGNAAMIADILFRDDKSILFLGEPGSGKTTIVREATRLLAELHNVLIVDTSNEIAGDGDVPHPCVGLARRLQVRHLQDQCGVMIEGVQNHTPEVMVIDEIGRPEEVDAARTCKMRGVRMIASAHGDLRKLVKNKQLKGLIGGIEVVTLGDEAARAEAKRQGGAAGSLNKVKAQRAGQPIFDVIVELHRGELHEWRIVMNCADAVDRILDGGDYLVQKRTRDPQTGELFLELQRA